MSSSCSSASSSRRVKWIHDDLRKKKVTEKRKVIEKKRKVKRKRKVIVRKVKVKKSVLLRCMFFKLQ